MACRKVLTLWQKSRCGELAARALDTDYSFKFRILERSAAIVPTWCHLQRGIATCWLFILPLRPFHGATQRRALANDLKPPFFCLEMWWVPQYIDSHVPSAGLMAGLTFRNGTAVGDRHLNGFSIIPADGCSLGAILRLSFRHFVHVLKHMQQRFGGRPSATPGSRWSASASEALSNRHMLERKLMLFHARVFA